MTSHDLVLTNATTADGRAVDVSMSDGRIASIEPAGTAAASPSSRDLDGQLLLGAPVEPHAHLDKALSADLVPNPAGDLGGAIEGWLAHRVDLDVADIAGRATRAARMSLANGLTAIRTHVDVGDGIGLRAVEALIQVREALAAEIDIQVVGLVSRPTTGSDGAGNRAALRDAISAGIDVVGGCPHIDPNPSECVDECLTAAAESGLPLDLHMDENLRPDSLDMQYLASRVVETGFAQPVTSSHTVSLGVQPLALQHEISVQLAEANIAVVTLPQTNLYLQGREHPESTPRGLTAIAPLLDAGVVLAAGADNLQDPFNIVGRADPFETAALMVMAGHMDIAKAWHSVTTAARSVMGLEPATVEVGSVADLVAVPAASIREAIASAPAARTVIKAGRVVAQSNVSQEFPLTD